MDARRGLAAHNQKLEEENTCIGVDAHSAAAVPSIIFAVWQGPLDMVDKRTEKEVFADEIQKREHELGPGDGSDGGVNPSS